MMNKTLFTMTAALVLSGSISLSAGKPVPYASDFYIDHTLDEGWQQKNNISRGGIPWSANPLNEDSWLVSNGATGGAQKIYSYDQDKTADAWLISPAVNVKAATEYTVSIYARTFARYGEKECFRITAAKSAEITDLKDGTVIINKPDYENLGEYEKITGTFTPDVDGEIYFGVQCFSEPDMDHLYVTKFSVTDGSEPGTGGDEPETPAEGKQLPWSFDFTDTDLFDAEWTRVAGPDAAVTASTWTCAPMGYANWDFAEGKKEDNWLISPALAVEKAGNYALDAKVWANGKLEMLIGTNPADLSTFTPVKTWEDSEFPSDADRPDRINYEINETGSYYLAFRACSEAGTYMGSRVYFAGFKEDVVTPQIVTDLTATADIDDQLIVNLSWTYPSLTNHGEALANGDILKAEVMRGNVVVETINYPTPGSAWAFADNTITEPGIYSYSVIIYGENGCDTDNTPVTASPGYVGKPIVDFPFSINSYGDSNILKMFTITDNNADGYGWEYKESSWDSEYISTYPGNNVEMDDYLTTPYIHLQPGYYLANYQVGGKNNTYELGYALNRHNPAASFVKVAEIVNEDYSYAQDHKIVIVISQEGDYCFSIHHVGTLTNIEESYYNEVSFGGFSIATQAILPETVTSLKVTAAADNSLSAVVEWVNPAVDNGGQPLTSISKAIIYRDSEVIATITEGLIPGEVTTYTDNDITDAGEHTYKTEIYNENGCSEKDAPEVAVYIGPGIEPPYETINFSDWVSLNVNDDWYKWEADWEGKFGISQGWNDPDDYALSPYIELASNHKYGVTVVTHADGTMPVDFVAGSSKQPAELNVIGEVTPEAQEKEHTFDFTTMTEGSPAAGDEDLPILLPGKNIFGFHAYTTGRIQLKSFKLVDKGKTSAAETVVAAFAEGISYANGTVHTSIPTAINVYTLDGRCVMSAVNTDSLDLTPLAKGQAVVIVAANPSGQPRTIKVVL